MEIYLVGGAVRDTLLGLPVQDRDWVVVGASPQQLIAQGYIAVGRDFPVFLHPRTKEEYALARTERSTAPGYKGFAFHAAPDVTLEQDLARRDLTINAMAVSQRLLDASGNFDPVTTPLEDPYHGRRDLQQRRLRHVTEAFHDDPVRILRVARFAARFQDFHVATDTLALMRSMVARGEADALVAERVWQELARGLMEDTPSRMLQVLADCDALAHLLPELADTHTNQDAAEQHRARRVDQAAHARAPLEVRFACLCRDVTDAARLGALCARVRAPNDCRDLALLAQRESAAVEHSGTLDAQGLVGLIERCDALRKPSRFDALLQVCAISAAVDGRSPQGLYAPRQRLRAALSAAQAVPTDAIAGQAMSDGKTGPQVGAAIRAARMAAVAFIADR
jgi:tRNA nucleotidyltransferase (CCA-adding enzyme)